MNSSRLIKIILLGNGGVGKTCLINQYVNQNFNYLTGHTIGVEFLTKDIIVDGNKFTLQIWDTAGQERFRSLRTPFYRGSDICILTFSVDDKGSFWDLDYWRREFFYYSDVKDLDAFPFVVLANKCDLPDECRVVSKTEALEWCKKNSSSNNKDKKLPCKIEIPYIETSAKNALNVGMGFEKAVRLWCEIDKQLESCFNEERLSGSLGNSRVNLKDNSSSRRLCCS